MVLQHFNLFPHLSVLDNLPLGPIRNLKQNRADAEAVAMEYLDRVHIADQAQKFPSQLSGGQQQRVALLRALRRDPDLILLDEPLSNIDPVLRGYVRRQLRQLLTESQTAAILVTHDIQDAAHLADQVALLNNGMIEQVGRLEQLYLNPQTEWVADFFDHINAGTVFGAMAKNDQLTPKMQERMQKGSKMPGWVRRSDFDWYETIVDRED